MLVFLSQGQELQLCLELNLHKVCGVGQWWSNVLLNLFNNMLIVRSIIYPDYIKTDIFCIILPLVGYICDGCTIAFECYDLRPPPGHSILQKIILISHYLYFYKTSIIKYTLYDFICTHTNRRVSDSWMIWMIFNYGSRQTDYLRS